MDKREMLEKVLVSYLEEGYMRRTLEEGFSYGQVLDALADQAIVIECEVEHDYTLLNNLTRIIILIAGEFKDEVEIYGHHGTPGKALAIILPLEDED